VTVGLAVAALHPVDKKAIARTGNIKNKTKEGFFCIVASGNERGFLDISGFR
jgi:hypothetical protein